MKRIRRSTKGNWFLISIGGVLAALGGFQLYNFYARVFEFGLLPEWAIAIIIIGLFMMFRGITKASRQADRRE
jgi:hypothetical protein